MFNIEFTPNFEKQLDKLDKKTIEKVLKNTYNLQYGLINNNNVKHLTNNNPKYRLRVGDYRIFFDIKSDTITIYEIRKRKEAY